MRNYKILNRPMFNRNNSAYGRGIASNLVSEEERVKYNSGGRVGYQDGDSVGGKISTIPAVKAAGGVGNWLNRQLYNIGVAGYNIPGVALNTLGRAVGYNPGFSGERFFQPAADYLGVKTKFTGEKPEDIDTAQLLFGDTYAPAEGAWSWEPKEGKIKQVEEPEKTGEPNIDIKSKGEGMPDSDQLWSPEEQKEKKNQIALAMAERLISGSRDKWGSKAQMENIGGALGDIRKITDPSDIREMQKKYKAWGKAQTEMEKAKYTEDMLVKQLRARGAGPTQAKEAVYFGEEIFRIPRGKEGKKQRADFAKDNKKFKIVYDQEKDVYILPQIGKQVKTIDELIEYRKQGII